MDIVLFIFLGLLGGMLLGFLIILILTKIQSRKDANSSSGDVGQIDTGFVLFDDSDELGGSMQTAATTADTKKKKEK